MRRSRLRRVGSVLAGVALVGSAPGTATAVDLPSVAGEPVTIDVTNTVIGSYHFDNRNASTADEGSFVDDDYADFIDRLNVQIGWWRLQLGVRIHAVGYLGYTNLDEAREIARELRPGDPEYPSQFYRELNTRYRSTVYPSKLWLTYTQPGLEATAGDFYAQLGRGLVFSVRKIDELGVDTTVRGGKVTADHDFGPLRIGATGLAGQLNPLRVEETSGRLLAGSDSPLFFGFPRAGSLVYYRFDEDPTTGDRVPVRVVEKARPSYLEDTALGAHVEIGNEVVLFGGNGSMILRKETAADNLACARACEALPADARLGCNAECNADFPVFSSNSTSIKHDTIRTFSGSVNLPNIAKHGDFYVEVAGQQLRDGRPVALGPDGKVTEREANLSGYAVYASGTARGGPVTLSLEGKHYRRFFPLSGNIDVSTKGFSAPEFNVVTYNSPPTAEPIYVEPIGAPQVCNTGGRARVDYRFTPHLSLYSWLGHYVSYSEIDAVNNECETAPEKRTNTWDAAIGADGSYERAKSHVKLWVGLREDTREVPAASAVSGVSPVFYREGYVRYDLTKHIRGPFAVQAQGFHRRRYEPVSFEKPWYEGENYTALQWAPHFAGIVGYEYSSKEGCEPGNADKSVCHYLNGGLQYKSASDEGALAQIFDTVTLFVGQRRGAIRCVSGVCRLFPAFEGAKVELVSRF